jgi:hypothetical protein
MVFRRPLTRPQQTRQSGGALFIVLLALALMALLTYAGVMSRKGSDNAAQENIPFAAASILRFGDNVHNAVQTAMTSGRADAAGEVSTLSFETTATGANYHNNNATNTTTVFGTTGGLGYTAPDALWLDSSLSANAFYGKWYFPKNVCVPFVGTGGDGATGGSATICSADSVDNEDVIMVLPYVRASICTAIDQKLNITLCSGAPCAASATILPAASTEFAGAFADGKAYYTTSGSRAFNGKAEGCIAGTGTSAGMYFYYKVLFER